jgi:RHS repeat-associated protein
VQGLGFDPVSRLSSLDSNLPGTANDQSAAFTYNPAGQIDTLTKSNNAYAWNGHYNIDRPYTANGLNQLITAGAGTGALSFTYDARGNLTASGSSTYTHTSENFPKSGPNAAALTYDPLGRLYQTSKGSAATTTRFAYDGGDMIAEYNASNVLLRRYVHGPGTDNPIVWYEGTGSADKRYMIADERGSITGIVKQDGSLLAINAYDEYGIPAATNVGRFGYTGQTWLPEIGMNYYKARIYSPTLGRFMQSDPIGFGGGMNLYAYVGGDPVNYSDPSGLYAVGVRPTPHSDPLAQIVVTGGRRVRPDCSSTLNGVCIDYLGGLIDLLQDRGNSLNFNRQRDGAIVVRGVRKKKSGRRGGITKICPSVPSPGAGKTTLDNNIVNAIIDHKYNQISPFSTAFDDELIFANHVLTDQNYKVTIRGSAPYGNFNFGATGRARGFSTKKLLYYSNQFQNISTGRNDPPEDIADIVSGAKYFDYGCYKP